MMVKFGDTVVMYGLVVNGALEEDEAMVLGAEEDFVWLYSTTSRKIYRHNPSHIKNHRGRNVLFSYDYCKSMNEVFDEQGELNSGVFWHASEAGRVKLTQLLKTFRLIDPRS
jgi:hypothetical protein